MTGADQLRAARLARLMPHACRALTRDSLSGRLAGLPREVHAEIFGASVDHLVRIATPQIGSKSASTRLPKSRRRSFTSLHDQWLHALRTPDPG